MAIRALDRGFCSAVLGFARVIRVLLSVDEEAIASSAAGTPGGPRRAGFDRVSAEVEVDALAFEGGRPTRLGKGAAAAGAASARVRRFAGLGSPGLVSAAEPPDRRRRAGGSATREVADAFRLMGMVVKMS